MMSPEAVKERIRFYTEVLKMFMLLSLTTGGGLAGLLFQLDRSPAIFLLFVGVILEVFFLSGATILYLTIEELLRRLEQ